MISANETYRSTGGDSQSRFEYVEVLLPLPLAAKFTYRLPPHLVGKPAQGSRVIVPFGRKNSIPPLWWVSPIFLLKAST